MNYTGGCHCGSGEPLCRCCRPYLIGEKYPETAQQLMRSRYTANVEHNGLYLLKTWHYSTRPDTGITTFGDWFGLQILQIIRGGADDEKGMVEFRALYHQGALTGVLREKSRFVREDGRWYYLAGEIVASGLITPRKTGRNDPCPCGSGRKYKSCCR